MRTKFIKTFTAGNIGSLELKNRIVMAPMGTRYHTLDGFVSQRQIEYYAGRARGGVGMIIVEASYPTSYKHKNRLLINDDKFLPGLTRLVDAIHAGGAKVVIQMNPHQGRLDKDSPLSASGNFTLQAGKKVHVLSITEIQKMVEEFGEGAHRVRKAGFDGVMIHAAHGYLVQEFLSPLTNKRKDKYGGDLKKRARFVLELAEITRQKTGIDYPVLCRLPGDERLEKGINVADAITTAKLLEAAGIDAIDIVSGALDSRDWVVPSMYYPQAYNTNISEAIRREVSIPILVTGKIKDPFLAEEILERGKADFVTIGRALISDPEFPQKMMDGHLEDICMCIGCLKCIQSIQYDAPLVCAVNPAVGKEREFAFKPADRKKKVLVVGGGPAGMQASLIASQRGHDVTLWEQSQRLGGQVILAAVPPGKEDLVPWIKYLTKQIEKAPVNVELGKEATPKSIMNLSPDAVIVATGAKPLTPKVKGLEEKRRKFFYTELLAGKTETPAKVIVLGGGYIGVETALFLAEKGNVVKLVEVLDEVAADAFHHIKTTLVLKLAENKVKVFTGVKEEEIVDGGMKIKDKGGKEIFIEADSLVIACGLVPNRDLQTVFRDKGPEFYEVGDCVEPRDILQATREGAAVALML